MPHVLIDDFSSAAPWAPLDAGNAPSAEIMLATDMVHPGYLPDAASLRIEASASASGHTLSRALVTMDLSDFSEVRFWFRSTRPSDGSVDRPFRLRLELGSALMPVGSPGNDWHRYLPAHQANTWHFVRVALDDLDPQVAGGVNAVRFTCENTTTSWTAWLDDLIACRPELIADVDRALIELLDGRLVLAAPVPARVHVEGAAELMKPWLRIIHYEAAYSDVRTTSQRPRTDFTNVGFRIRPESVAYDLYYRIEAAATDRAAQAVMLQFVLDTLGHRSGLLVNGGLLPLDRVPTPLTMEELPTEAALCYRIATRQEHGAYEHVVPVQDSRLTVDLRP